ncbi:MAG: hypothetical protein J6T39_00930, partial [Clostridia bacterium]|nr:hypothetical protein [Clostridia bacterium]
NGIRVAGLAGDNIAHIANSISLGNIAFTISDYNALNYNIYTGVIAGFTTSITDSTSSSNNYALSTIKAASETDTYSATGTTVQNGAIYATSPKNSLKNNGSADKNDGVNYNYNLSGVFQSRVFGSNTDYSTLASSVRSVLSSGTIISTQRYNQNYTNSGTLKTGIKINPVLLQMDTSSTSISNYVSNGYKYYVVNNMSGRSSTFNFTSNGAKITNMKSLLRSSGVNVIANSSDNAETIYYFPASNTSEEITIHDTSFISGLELRSVQNIQSNYAPIYENDGYVFNTTTNGRLVATSNSIGGFVYYNYGIINACLSMTYLDEDYSTNGMSGFVRMNYKTIINSSSTNVFYNLNTNNTRSTITGFTYYNYRNIINCFASGSAFDKTGMGDADCYDNVRAFYKSESGATWKNNCYDDYSNNNGFYSANSNATAKVYSDCIGNNGQTKAMFHTDQNDSVDYGYSVPTSYVSSTTNLKGAVLLRLSGDSSHSSEDNDLAYSSLGTGSNTISDPYRVNNIGRFNYLMSSASTLKMGGASDKKILYMSLVHDIDASRAGTLSTTYWGDSTSSVLHLNNDFTYTLYGLTLNVSPASERIGLFNASTVNISNLGVIGKFSGTITQATKQIGLLVGSANTLTMTGCFVILKSSLTINVLANSVGGNNAAGLLVGEATNVIQFKNNFAHYNTITLQCNDTSKIGGIDFGSLIGNFKMGSSGIEYPRYNFAAGKVKIESS